MTYLQKLYHCNQFFNQLYMRRYLLSLVFNSSLILSLIVCTGCSCTVKNKEDPLEGYNRGMYKVNKILDTTFIKPITKAYVFVVPKPIKMGVSNFYQNLRTIPTVFNDILQLDRKAFYSDTARLVINTTLGLGGILDVASKAGLERRYSDFGHTLARWGFKNSTYVVLPFFGPSTFRDSIGLVVTYYMSAWPWIASIRHHHHKAIALRNYLVAGDIIDTRANLLDIEPVIDAASIDEYILVRDAYLQNRRFVSESRSESEKLNNNNTETSSEILEGPPE